MQHYRLLTFFLFFFFVQQLESAEKGTDHKLDDVIDMEFKARDSDNDGVLTFEEIRNFYLSHPEKMSAEGIDFLDKNFEHGVPTDIKKYREIVKRWLAENGSIEKIILGMFGNNTRHLKSHHVHRLNHTKTTTESP